MGVVINLDHVAWETKKAYCARKEEDWESVYQELVKIELYPGLGYLVNEMARQGIKIVVITEKPEHYATRMLSYFQWLGKVKVHYREPGNKAEAVSYYSAVRMVRDARETFIIGSKQGIIAAAERTGTKSVLLLRKNGLEYQALRKCPDVMCKDQGNLFSYFAFQGVPLQRMCLRKREDNSYYLFDYFAKSRGHDLLSEKLYAEVKGENDSHVLCEALCTEIINKFTVTPESYGVFVVPSSTEGCWNKKLTGYVAKRLVDAMGVHNCAGHIRRHTTREKQSHGGSRSMELNISTMEIAKDLPRKLKGAFVIDDITTTGNSFMACKKLLMDRGLEEGHIYCIALGGTVYTENSVNH